VKWTKRLRDVLQIADEVSEILIHLRDSPKPSDYASIGLRLVNSSLSHYDKFSGNPFKGWKDVELFEFCQFLFEIVKNNHKVETVQEKESTTYYLSKIYDIEFGWKDRDGYISGPYIKEIEHSEALSVLGRMIWENMGTTSCVLKKKNRSEYENGTMIVSDDLEEEVYESQAAIEILERSKSFIDNGYNRSIMLYGRPGTGKTSIMKYIAREMGGHILRINVADLDNLDSEDMLSAIDLLQPNILIIDDFDRVTRPEKFLSDLEKFNKKIKLFIVSVNSVSKLDDAVIRPGRFDDILKLEKIDKEIVDQLIGDVPKDVHDRLSELPIAYVSEFNKRKEILGVEKAIEEVVELEQRISQAIRERRSDDEDWEEIDEDPSDNSRRIRREKR